MEKLLLRLDVDGNPVLMNVLEDDDKYLFLSPKSSNKYKKLQEVDNVKILAAKNDEVLYDGEFKIIDKPGDVKKVVNKFDDNEHNYFKGYFKEEDDDLFVLMIIK